MNPIRLERFRHYADIYKKFIRPIMPTCKMYHHAPVSSTGGVESGGWFAVEYAAPDRSKGWATIIRIGTSDSPEYIFKPRGLDPGRTYRVTFDSTGCKATVAGMELIRDGIPVRLETLASSELLLFEAQ